MKQYLDFKNSRISEKVSKPFLRADLPLAGQFLKEEEIGTDFSFPLTLSFCDISTSIQVNESIDPNILFKKYLYKTGTINTLVNHFADCANMIINELKHESILDLGCNDFTFLKNFLGKSKTILGIDPSDISKNNQVDGISLENEFFSHSLSEGLKSKYGQFDVIFSSNNFAHIENIRDYTSGISNLIKDGGTFVCEVHWVGALIKNIQFPFIYHEHLYYHTLKALSYLLNQYGLFIYRVQDINVHGGSMRIFASKTSNKQDESVESFYNKEDSLGLYRFQTYLEFSDKILQLKKSSREILNKLKDKNKKIYGYGASGQANTLMSFFDITKDDLSFIIDDSPVKHNLYTPKNHIQIKNREFLNQHPANDIYILAYTFEKEIREKNKDLLVDWHFPF
jgi:SAM-dependent methyltransferase